MSVERFMRKHASFASVFPAVAGPALGGYAGYNLGSRFLRGKGPPEAGGALGVLLGTLTMGTAGKLLSERVEEAEKPQMPPGAPYTLDPSSVDIPAWALEGAHALQPALKMGSALDMILGEVPGASVVQRGMGGGLGEAGKAFLGMSGGGVAGGLAGLGLGKAIEHFTGPANIPLVNLPLHELLAGIGGSLGATKGLRHLSPEKQGA